MTGEKSTRYEIQRYQKLINDYVDNGSTELGNFVLTGDELLDFAEATRSTENYYEKYKEIEEAYQKLINNLESLFKGKKEGSLVTKVKILLNNAKENLEEDK